MQEMVHANSNPQRLCSAAGRCQEGAVHGVFSGSSEKASCSAARAGPCSECWAMLWVRQVMSSPWEPALLSVGLLFRMQRTGVVPSENVSLGG